MDFERGTRRAVLALAVVAALHTPSEAQVTCGQVISTPRTFNVTNDLTGCTGHGLRVTASNVKILCDEEIWIEGVGSAGQYGILVESSGQGPLENVVVENCNISNFNRGIRFNGVSGGEIKDNVIYDSVCPSPCPSNAMPYGVDVAGGSTGITIDGNEVVDSYDEGIHVSGQTGSPVSCQANRPGGHTITNNTVVYTAQLANMPDDGEALYVLCSDGNLIESNTMIRDNDGPGLFLEDSRDNVVRYNAFINDPIHVKSSERNAIFDNVVTAEDGQGSVGRLVVESSSANFFGKLAVEGDGDAPAAAYVFRDGSTCNQFYDSSAFGVEDFDIVAQTGSGEPSNVNNRFFKYVSSFSSLMCDQTGDTSSTIDVYDPSNALVGCNSTTSPSVVPSECATWWFYSDLCGVAAQQENDATIRLEGEDITGVRYVRANVGEVETGEDAMSVPLRVTSTGCVHLAGKTSVVLGPGTTIEGRLHAQVY